MIKKFARLFLYLAIFGIASAPSASGQSGQVFVQPTPLHRFQVSYWDGGHLLTANFQEGLANGYTFDPFNYPIGDDLAIYVPPPGYTPDPSSGLVPLHRWTVIQSGWRTYFYYSTYYFNHGSDYHYNGIAGWVFTPGRTSVFVPGLSQSLPLRQLSVWYSQDLGYWNGEGAYPDPYREPPPNRPGKRPYYDHGVIAALPPCANPPPGGLGCAPYVVAFNQPPPQPVCDPDGSLEQQCSNSGGIWDQNSCSCSYFNPCGGGVRPIECFEQPLQTILPNKGKEKK